MSPIRSRFPVAGAASVPQSSSPSIAHPKQQRPDQPKKPLVKKACSTRFKHARIRERLQWERQRGTPLVGPDPAITPTIATTTFPNTSTSNRTTFQPRFENQPIKFKVTQGFSPYSQRSIQSPVAPKTRRMTFPSSTAMKKTRTTIPIGQTPRKRGSRSRRGNQNQISPPTRPTIIPPTTTTQSSERKTKATKKDVVKTTAKKIESLQKRQQLRHASFEPKGQEDYLASHLCLIPLVIRERDEDTATITCHWPCLVFSGLHKAMLCHKQLYPHQKKVQRRLQKRYLKASTTNLSQSNGDGEIHRVVVLPLGDAEGCCPPEVCRRPLFDVVDATCSTNHPYWTTISKKEGAVVEGGNKVVRLLENHETLGAYVIDSKNQVPLLGPETGPALENALVEMERLCYLKDESHDDDDDDDDDDDIRIGNDHKNDIVPFVSSLKRAAETSIGDKNQSGPRVLEFPRYSYTSERKKSKRRISSSSSSNSNRLAQTTSAIEFPRTPKPPKRARSSFSFASPGTSTSDGNSSRSAAKVPPLSRADKSNASMENRTPKNMETEERSQHGIEFPRTPKASKPARASFSFLSLGTSNSDGNLSRFAAKVLPSSRADESTASIDDGMRQNMETKERSPHGISSSAEMTVTAEANHQAQKSSIGATIVSASGVSDDNRSSSAEHVANREAVEENTLASSRAVKISGSAGDGSPQQIETEEQSQHNVSLPTKTTMTAIAEANPLGQKDSIGARAAQSSTAMEMKKKKEPIAKKKPTTKKKKMLTTIPKKQTVINCNVTIAVSSWRVVKPLLARMGHIFYEQNVDHQGREELFCRPNGDPRTNTNAIEGEDYFKDRSHYRAYLCAHGVEYVGNSSAVNEDDRELVCYWVRFHIFTQKENGGEKNRRIADLELLGKKWYIKLLQRIGYKYESGALTDGYVIPGEAKKRYFTEKELWRHLGRYGLSPSCEFEKFESREERIALEIHILRKYHGVHGDKIFRHCIKTNQNQSIGMESQECTAVASTNAREECTQGLGLNCEERGEEAMLPRKLMTEETGMEKNSVAAEENNEMGYEQADSGNSEMIDSSADQQSEKVQIGEVSMENELTVVEPSASLEQRAEDTIKEVDLAGSTNEEKLSACLVNLKNNEIAAYGQLSKSITRIKSFVNDVIESKGRNGDGPGFDKSPILYICGNPGTGKTLSATKICNNAVDAKNESKNKGEKAPRVCYISCPSIQNFNYEAGMKKVMERMKMKQSQLKRSSNDHNNSATILILDEVDQLLGCKGTESILKQLSTWAKDENYMLSIIAISNAVYNAKTNRLKEFGIGRMSGKLVFQTYRKDDLVKMSQSKIGFTVVDKKAHEFIAAKVANSCGDARQYFDLIEKSVIFCRRKLSPEKRVGVYTKPIVMIRNAMLAIRETNRKIKDIIQSLTSIEKMTLCAGVHLARKYEGRPVQLGKLKEHVCSAIDFYEHLSLEDFKGVIERLSDSGLLQLNTRDSQQPFTSLRMFSLLQYPIQFDLQLEDVDSALEDTLMKEDWYKRMVERVRRLVV